ncbi:hypothetical protein CDEF62S_05570 [Castellaniella defragrans]
MALRGFEHIEGTDQVDLSSPHGIGTARGREQAGKMYRSITPPGSRNDLIGIPDVADDPVQLINNRARDLAHHPAIRLHIKDSRLPPPCQDAANHPCRNETAASGHQYLSCFSLLDECSNT